MNAQITIVLGMTLLIMMLVGILILVIMRFRGAVMHGGQTGREDHSESAFMAAAMHEAVMQLRVKEQAQQARADASERLSEDIVSGITSGLVVITAEGETRIINPAARRLLNVPEVIDTAGKPYLDVIGQVPPLAEAIDESLRSQQPIVRRVLDLRELASVVPVGAMQLGVTVSPIVDAKAGAGGRFQGIICLLNDLTSVVAMEERLRLRESLAQVWAMPAVISPTCARLSRSRRRSSRATTLVRSFSRQMMP